MNLNIKVDDDYQHGKIIHLSGEIDAYTAPELKNTLLPLTEEKDAFIKVDFANVTYMDSTGLGVFINALKLSEQHDSSIQLIHVNERILRLFTITGLNEIMDIQSSIRGDTNHGSI